MKKVTKTSQLPGLLKELQEGVRAVFESDKYWEYLSAMARFHRYSVKNQIFDIYATTGGNKGCIRKLSKSNLYANFFNSFMLPAKQSISESF